MSDTIIIHIPAAQLRSIVDEHRWEEHRKLGDCADSDTVCLDEAVRMCEPQPGDAHLIREVRRRRYWEKNAFNHLHLKTEAERLYECLDGGITITDVEMAHMFGGQWRAVLELNRRAASLTTEETHALGEQVRRLGISERVQARGLALEETDYQERNARFGSWVRTQTLSGAYGVVARSISGRVERDDYGMVVVEDEGVVAAVTDAAVALTTWDIAQPAHPNIYRYDVDHRSVLLEPWRSTFGALDVGVS